MENDYGQTGSAWLIKQVERLTDEIVRITPSKFNEENRYLPSSVTPEPGPMSWDFNPYMREIIDCFDVDSPVREINVLKGVKVTYSTVLDSVIFYFAAHVKVLPVMYVTAEKELADARMQIDIVQMFNQSGFADLIKSGDEGNKRKTGKTKQKLDWGPEGYLVPQGATNAKKARQFSVAIMLQDEIAGWPDVVGKDGDPVKLFDARTDGYSDQRKIGRGSTPLLHPCKMEAAYLRGDQRKYLIKCLECGHPQELRWSDTNARGEDFGISWSNNEDGQVDKDSVRYVCCECGHPHKEHDKIKIFSPDYGAEWVPTAIPKAPHIRSYHLPGMYSMTKTWYEQVLDYLEGWDVENNRMRDVRKYQVFYNNVLGRPFQFYGSKVSIDAASMHRRTSYSFGDVPNKYAEKHSGGPILFLTCTVDVHKSFLAVAVWGWTKGFRCYLIDYIYMRDESEVGCESIESPAWVELRKLVDERKFRSDDGLEYSVMLTLIDSGYAASVVYGICADYDSGWLPIKGISRVGRAAQVREFWKSKLPSGVELWNISVDHYKDRLAPVLRREWIEGNGKLQDIYHFNAPVDITQKQLKELTVERRQSKTDDHGKTTHVWDRPNHARNELWDLMVYANASVEMIAADFCIVQNEMDSVDWVFFWDNI